MTGAERGIAKVWDLLLAGLLAAGSVTAVELHVSTNGKDSQAGTSDQPLATLQGAQAMVRSMIVKGLKEPVTVIIHGGTYYLSAPLKLTPEDSGTADCPITWQAAKGENVVLSGGLPIKGTWSKNSDGIWSVSVPETKGKWNFRQLFVNEKRAVRARFPNVTERNPFLYVTQTGDEEHIMSRVTLDPKRVKECWGAGPDVQINLVPDCHFFNQWNTVTRVDPAKGWIDLADIERHGKIQKGDWFWIEGVKEELDEPHEWYLDRDKGVLYYMPEPGVDPNTLSFVAPRLNVLVDAKGDVEKKTHVEYVNFINLEFRHTTFTMGHIEARVHTDACLRFENASHCRVENGHVENVGGYAFWFHLDSKRNIISRNTVLNSGGGGVLFTGAKLSYMTENKLYTPGKVAATVFPILNRIMHNTVKHCGKVRYYGGGVHLDSRPANMLMEPGNYIAHNYFTDLSRNGIFAFRNQGGNVIEYNHIHDAMQTTVDGACIHLASLSRLKAPDYVLNNWLYDIWGYKQQPNGNPIRILANGIFLDWDHSNTTVKNNYIYNSGEREIKVIWWKGDKNVIVDGNHTSKTTRIVPPFVNEVGPDGTATHGIDMETNRYEGRVVKYNDEKLVIRKGNWKEVILAGKYNAYDVPAVVTGEKAAEIVYELPVEKKGIYRVYHLHRFDGKYAKAAQITVHHADGVSEVQLNLQEDNSSAYTSLIGKYPLEPGKPARLTLTNKGGVVNSVGAAFVKMDESKEK